VYIKLPGRGNATVTQEPTLQVHGIEVTIFPPKGVFNEKAPAHEGTEKAKIITQASIFRQ